ncbi:unnamed protein product [Caretta caretta]
MELPLTLVELLEALRRISTNKSPGMDGLTVEFYRVFWDVLSPDHVTVWADYLESGVLPLLCSMDYKVIAKAISLQLGSMLIRPTLSRAGPSLIICTWSRTSWRSFTLLSLDQEKVFDRMDHGYLPGTLGVFGFRPQFVGFLQVLYTDVEGLARLDWILTEPVSFGQGVRQRCPLSGQLYALVIEPFLCLLCQRLTGLVLWEPEMRLVLSAYADDVLLVVQDLGDLVQVKACRAIYSAASSSWVNWVKSSGLVVGDGWQFSVGEIHSLAESNTQSNTRRAGHARNISTQIPGPRHHFNLIDSSDASAW